MSADEFDIIAKHFAPLAQSDAARGLVDDVAVLACDGRVVLTTDTIVEGVHFLSDDPIGTVAQKALRVNLSDIAAKGAAPLGALLALTWPRTRPAEEIAAFADGLREDLQHYGVRLLGGDTTATPGPLTITVTLIGKPFGERVPARADAQAGDDVWVTGVIGDGWLGLQARLGWLEGEDGATRTALASRYQLPDPPTAFAPAIAKYARASMDVSDGLVGDAAKIAAASNLCLRLDPANVPISDLAQAWLARAGKAQRLELLSGGDDYQILFTAEPGARASIETEAAALGVRVTRIGVAAPGEGVVGMDGTPLTAGGHRHRLGQ